MADQFSTNHLLAASNNAPSALRPIREFSRSLMGGQAGEKFVEPAGPTMAP